MKRCPTCGFEKSPEDFYADRSRRDGLTKRCRDCEGQRLAARYQRDKVRINEAACRRDKARRAAAPPRLCVRCGEPALTRKHRYCLDCRPRRSWTGERKKRSTIERGYGAEHQRERGRYAEVVEAGGATCARCGGPIPPGSSWHLDHTDDRTGYLGPSHPSCNARAARVAA